MTITLHKLNRMNKAAFTTELGSIFEHSPWVAELVWEHKPFASVDRLLKGMMDVVLSASEDRIIGLLRAHPDLGTRIKLGNYSTAEQRDAGLDTLTSEEHQLFSELNRAYVERFGFPFILAVRGKIKEEIVTNMRERIGNTRFEERQKALEQVQLIACLRLADIIGT